MFIGEYQHALDAKNRIIIPAKFREDLGEQFVMTKGLDSCIFVYAMDEWSIFQDKLKSLPITNKNARMFVRFFLSGAVECEWDKQGRVVIPQNLRDYAELEKEVISIGVGNRVEIWSKSVWKTYQESDSLTAEALAESMEALGI